MTFPSSPWQSAFPDIAEWDAPTRTGTVPELLRRTAVEHPDREALRFADLTIRYGELDRMVEAVADRLAARGIRPGDHVATLLPNLPSNPVVFFALARLGAVIVQLSPLDAPRMLAFKLADSAAKLLVVADLPPLAAAAAALKADGAVPDAVVARLPGSDPNADRTLDALPIEADPKATPRRDPRAPEPSDLLLLQYTAGSSGKPKAAMLTHANLVASVGAYLAWSEDPDRDRHRIVIAALPLFHIYALTTILLCGFARGDLVVLHARFDPQAVLDDIVRLRATDFSGVPTMWNALVGLPATATSDLTSLREIASGGAPIADETVRRVQHLTGSSLKIGWGMSETAPAGTRTPPGTEMRPGVIGIPLPGLDMRIVDLDDPEKTMPPGELGELAVAGPNVFSGYWNRPGEARFTGRHFLTGDIGAMDEQGVFTLADRRSRMFISSGFNIYPAIVENAVMEHPDIAETIVIGIPDDYRGESGKAFVTLRPGAAPPTLEALRDFLSGRLGRHEIPAHLEIRDSLPKSPAGKLLATDLIDEERARAGKNRLGV